MKRLIGLFFVFQVVATIGFSQEPADVVITAPNIVTMNPNQPRAQAIAVRAGEIVFVGDVDGANPFIGAVTERISIRDGLVLPGLTDAHGHLGNLGRYLENLRLVGTSSANEVAEMVKVRQRDVNGGEWIRGRGWDQNDWASKAYPTWRDLRETEANPVYLDRVDGHAIWANRTAMKVAGVTRDTPDPEGGKILRDDDGEPTGIFIDNAEALIEDAVPPESIAVKMRHYRTAVAECHRLGLTGVHDVGVGIVGLEALKRISADESFPLRTYVLLNGDQPELVADYFKYGPRTMGQGRIVIRALKLYADGALGSRGAYLHEPYDDEPEHVGLPVTPESELNRIVAKAFASGFQVCVHAIGDRGNSMVLDAYEHTMQHLEPGDYRPRIEHAQVLQLADIPRFARLGVIASMQPTHCTSDMYWAEERVGSTRIRGAYAWRKLLDAEVHLAFGSDFPVEGVSPLWGIYAAVTRQDHDGWPEGGWYPEERLTLDEAIAGFTIGAAYARFAEDELGSIEVGKAADFTILDRDITAIPTAEILKATVLYTIVGGETVFRQ